MSEMCNFLTVFKNMYTYMCVYSYIQISLHIGTYYVACTHGDTQPLIVMLGKLCTSLIKFLLYNI